MRTVAEIHDDIRTRHAKSPSKFSYFFVQWIKFMDHSDALYEARGDDNETYLQYLLGRAKVDLASTVFDTICTYWREKNQENRVFSYLNHEDQFGNGIWHYLAGALQNNEGFSTLRIARALLAMDIDFSKRNKKGESPLSKMLLPSPRWQSLNALVQAKHLSIENVERAISEQAGSEENRNHLMSRLFSSDIQDNNALLSQHVLKQAVQPQADLTLRAATCRLFFDYRDEKNHSSAFFKLIGIANHAMFDDLMRLLMQNTVEVAERMPAPDIATKKAYLQRLFANRMLARDNTGEGVLFKALDAQKYSHMAKITSLLRNDDLVVNVMQRGETIRKPFIIDKDSPAPTNPLLSLLLQQDADGNTVLHWATVRSDLQALKRLLSGLAPNDMYAIITAFPNKAGVTLLMMVNDPEGSSKKLFKAALDKAMVPARAKQMVDAIGKIDPDVKDYLLARINEIEELAKSVGRKGPLPPTFRLPGASPSARP